MAHHDELAYLTIAEAAALIRRRKISPVELTRAMLERIAQLNPRLNAYITVCSERALADARRAERELFGPRGSRKRRGPLHGIPISIKDNIYTKGVRTTGGSKILRDFVPKQDATIVANLREAGAVLLGKTNLHEFAYGVTTENPHYGATRNPWDTSRIAGGSSGGSAAALAAGMCFGSIGTDTGGSIRIPAALCGIVGFKPWRVRGFMERTIALSPLLDHIGPLARSVHDAANLFECFESICTVKDTHEIRQLARGKGWRQNSLRGLRVGIPENYFFERLDDEIRNAMEAAIRFFAKKGSKVQRIKLPLLAASEKAGTDIALPEATEYHREQGWWPACAVDYGEDVRMRLQLGEEARAEDYIRALKVRDRMFREWVALFERIDVMVVPTTPIAAPLLGETKVKWPQGEENIRAALLRLCRPANLAAHSAISVPCGFTRGGLPIGMQLIANFWLAAKLLRIAHAYEQAHEWHRAHPRLSECET